MEDNKTAKDETMVLEFMSGVDTGISKKDLYDSLRSSDHHVITALCYSHVPMIRRNVAQNPSAPPPVVEHLLWDTCDAVSAKASLNPSLAKEAITRYILHEKSSPEIKMALLGHKNIDPQVINTVVFSDFLSVVRGVAAQSKHVSLENLIILSQDNDFIVRSSVARNINTPGHILHKLSCDNLHMIIRAVAANSSTSYITLDSMYAKFRDSDNMVNTMCNIAANPSCSLETLDALSVHPSCIVRGSVASNTSLTSDFLSRFIYDDTPYVRTFVACNPSLSYEYRVMLAIDTDKKVSEAAVGAMC